MDRQAADFLNVLNVVLREMLAYGRGWRGDWSNFDGRLLRNQLNSLNDWAMRAVVTPTIAEYQEGTEFAEAQSR